jgi:hypothetical protein
VTLRIGRDIELSLLSASGLRGFLDVITSAWVTQNRTGVAMRLGLFHANPLVKQTSRRLEEQSRKLWQGKKDAIAARYTTILILHVSIRSFTTVVWLTKAAQLEVGEESVLGSAAG